ncbi:ABC transporter ATP-binding protein/permease [Crenobacter sp. SG2303]|uniref:ABC transporter ATP-binding protein/permease n=1 Tax=Crenobacter oryzisoli TaxID=3056844 RepID=A0ABT7XSK4_9NEIS|nr:ABC transporter ATP-binding protein/permease [Crenobacter sp. SG2303]MDN0076787.1 ABC transporter ATP-binding protein/permease [Crenobacter sp. SG2303]
MHWNQELLTSAVWLAKAYGITVVLFVAASYLLVRSTLWGKQFWELAGPYFSPRRSWRPLAVLALILLLTLTAVRINVLISIWYNGMYTALQKLDEPAFWVSLQIFAVLASVHIARILLDYYIQQRFSIHWRVWLNEYLLSRWLDKQAYHRSQYLSDVGDNPDQRIQQDIASYVSSSLSLSMGVVNAMVSTFAYTLILWGLSGELHLFGLVIPRGMVFLVYVYVLIGTVIAFKIGRPLIRLNFLNERFNADYRYTLVRVREYAESIAFYRGEKVEGALLRNRFGRLIDNVWRIVFRSMKFQGFNLIVSQISVVFPMIIQAQRFFTKQITLGDLMQTSQAFGTLHDNLSFFRSAYDDFAGYRAVLNRLSGFTDAIVGANELPTPNVRDEGRRVALEGLTLRTPANTVLLEDVSLSIDARAPLLIRGRSGAGKTTLLRAIAGLWPYCDGQIVRPANDVLFLSQKPYLPLGTLRDALYYPATPDLQDDERAQQSLIDVQLGHLIHQLDDPADWGRILSLGEQQRLAFGRLLLAHPVAAFLDEATSAMDEGMEDAMYRLVRERLTDTILVSVGHRSTLLAHHPRQLELSGEGRWKVSDSVMPALQPAG